MTEEKKKKIYNSLVGTGSLVDAEYIEHCDCEDAISRQAVIEYIEGEDAELAHDIEKEAVIDDIKKIPSVQPCEDAISKQTVEHLANKYVNPKDFHKFMNAVNELPSVQPTRQKGEWIRLPKEEWYGHEAKCSVCGGVTIDDNNYCPNCGADMRGEKE